MGFGTNRRQTHGEDRRTDWQSTDHASERKIEREIHRDTAMKTITKFGGRLREGQEAKAKAMGRHQPHREVWGSGFISGWALD